MKLLSAMKELLRFLIPVSAIAKAARSLFASDLQRGQVFVLQHHPVGQDGHPFLLAFLVEAAQAGRAF